MSGHRYNLEYINAPEFKKEVLKLFEGGGAVVIDLSDVDRASFASIQILLAAYRKAQMEGLKIVFHLSDTLSANLTDLGFEEIVNNERAG